MTFFKSWSIQLISPRLKATLRPLTCHFHTSFECGSYSRFGCNLPRMFFPYLFCSTTNFDQPQGIAAFLNMMSIWQIIGQFAPHCSRSLDVTAPFNITDDDQQTILANLASLAGRRAATPSQHTARIPTFGSCNGHTDFE